MLSEKILKTKKKKELQDILNENNIPFVKKLSKSDLIKLYLNSIRPNTNTINLDDPEDIKVVEKYDEVQPSPEDDYSEGEEEVEVEVEAEVEEEAEDEGEDILYNKVMEDVNKV